MYHFNLEANIITLILYKNQCFEILPFDSLIFSTFEPPILEAAYKPVLVVQIDSLGCFRSTSFQERFIYQMRTAETQAEF